MTWTRSANSKTAACTHHRRSIVVWCFTDGRPGHRRQIEGLIGQLAMRRPVSEHWIDVTTHQTLGRLSRIIPPRIDATNVLPDPQLILAAGHATHLPALAARRTRGGKSVVLMRPTLPTPLFDLCLIPEHDLLSLLGRYRRMHVIPTRGVLNPFMPSLTADPTQALLLIGGPSRHHGWSDAAMIEQVQEVVRLCPTNVQWTLTTSRRTPPTFLKKASETLGRDRCTLPIEVVAVERTSPDWLWQQLSQSQTVFVSEDSISMVYESLTVGADVGLLSVPRLRRRSRNARCIDRLQADRLVVGFDDWCVHRFEQRETVSFHEASRCADVVCERLLDAA